MIIDVKEIVNFYVNNYEIDLNYNLDELVRDVENDWRLIEKIDSVIGSIVVERLGGWKMENK